MPVISPICNGKLSFIKPGNSTLPKAIASPSRNVPMSKVGVVPSERMIIPAVNKIREPNRVSSIPKRRASFGANGEIMANASRGIVVKKPAKTFEIPKLSLTEEIIGPTTVKGERRVIAINTTPISRSQVLRVNDNFLVVC